MTIMKGVFLKGVGVEVLWGELAFLALYAAAIFLARHAQNETEAGVSMWERIGVIVRKEFIQALREPRMRMLLFVPPLVQLLVFGFAVNLDVDHTRIAWMDMDRTPLSRELRARFEGSGRFEVVAEAASEDDVQRALDRGEAQAVVRVLPSFARDVLRGVAGVRAGADRRNELEYGVAGGGLRRVGGRGVFARRFGGAAECATARRGARGAGQRRCPAGESRARGSGSTPICTAGTTSCPA